MLFIENPFEGDAISSVKAEEVQKARNAQRRRALNNRASELSRLRANSKKTVPQTWGQNERSVWGVWESGIAEFTKGLGSLIHESRRFPRARSLGAYLQGLAKEKPHISILELGGTAGQLAKDVHELPGLEKAYVVGAALTDPRSEEGEGVSPYPPINDHDVIVADVFSPKGYSGDGSLGGFGSNSEHLFIDGINAVRNSRTNDGRFSAVIVKMEKPMLGLSSPEEMYMVQELVLAAYEKTEAGGAVMLQLPEHFPTRTFERIIKRSKAGKHIEIVRPHRSLGSKNMLIERKVKSPDSLREIFGAQPLIKMEPGPVTH